MSQEQPYGLGRSKAVILLWSLFRGSVLKPIFIALLFFIRIGFGAEYPLDCSITELDESEGIFIWDDLSDVLNKRLAFTFTAPKMIGNTVYYNSALQIMNDDEVEAFVNLSEDRFSSDDSLINLVYGSTAEFNANTRVKFTYANPDILCEQYIYYSVYPYNK